MSEPVGRLFAIIPAAGHSRRMGQPKLMMSLGGQTVIARLLTALRHPAIASCLVVVRKDDAALRDEVARHGGTLVCPEVDPPEMRASVEAALDWIRATSDPQPQDGWLLIPADHPVLEAAVIGELIDVWQRERPRLLAPTYQGRRGHPLIVSWELASDVAALPTDQGVNMLVRQHESKLLTYPVTTDAVLVDLDDPADFAALSRRFAMFGGGIGQYQPEA